MMTILLKILKFFAKNIVKKYQPEIVGITGSVGKTSAKEAIFSVLSFEYNTRRNISRNDSKKSKKITQFYIFGNFRLIHSRAVFSSVETF